MVIRTELKRFLKSKHHKPSVNYISGCPLKERYRKFNYILDVQKEVGLDMFLVWRGRSELLKYLHNDLEIDEKEEKVDLVFKEGFTVYFRYFHGVSQFGERPRPATLVLIDCKRIWLPREECKVSSTPYSFGVVDTYFGVFYEFPELYYPKNQYDIREFMIWLRVHRLTLDRDYRGDKISHTKLWDHWNRLKLTYIKFGEYRKNLWPVHIPMETDKVESPAITQEIVDKFIDWTKTRFRIIR